MKVLPKEFIGKGEVRGFKFKLLITNPDTYLYEVTYEGQKHYEVFLRKMHRRFGHVMYPKSKAFGKWAWHFGYLDKAEKKFYSLK